MLLLALLAGVVVLTLAVAATGALAFPVWTQSQDTIGPCGACHTAPTTHAPTHFPAGTRTAHTGIGCGTCHVNGTAQPPTPPACASCHGTQVFDTTQAGGTAHVAEGCTGTCHTAITPTPTATPTVTPTATPTADTTPPRTTASGAVNNRCYNRSLSIRLSATDAGGVASITYRVDGGAPVVVMGASATVALTVDRTGHTTDGVHVVTYFATDVAGNVEATRTIRVRIDTVKPRTAALAVARAHRFEFTNLRYRISDAAPTCGRANVIIRIRRGATVVRTLRLGVKPVNRALSARIQATLAPGSYRYYVYARDLAGNTQSSVGSNRLIISGAFGGGSW